MFGGFYRLAVQEQGEDFFDPNKFALSFVLHGQCITPERFVMKENAKRWKFVSFFRTGTDVLLAF